MDNEILAEPRHIHLSLVRRLLENEIPSPA
jgi:hypothetical protein